MSSKVVAVVFSGAILIAAGFVFAVVSPPGVAGAEEHSPGGRALEFLDGVLNDLVAEGTISEDDASAVLTAVEAEIEELQEEHPGWEHPRRHLLRKGARIGALLDDGGITQEEFDQLPDQSPLRQLDLEDALADDLITPEELRAAWRQHHRG